MITEGQIMIKKLIFITFLVLLAGNLNAETKTYKMVFVPASEKGEESDYTTLISITEKLTGFNIETIKVTDYNAAVEAMRAGRAHIAWYGGKTYVKAAENAGLELLTVDDHAEMALSFFSNPPSDPPPVNLGHLMGTGMPEMVANAGNAIKNGTVSPVLLRFTN